MPVKISLCLIARDEAAQLERCLRSVQGAVDEWRYKVGVDGEPAVGMALQVIDLQSGEVLCSGVGAKSGWSREALAAIGGIGAKKLDAYGTEILRLLAAA